MRQCDSFYSDPLVSCHSVESSPNSEMKSSGSAISSVDLPGRESQDPVLIYFLTNSSNMGSKFHQKVCLLLQI